MKYLITLLDNNRKYAVYIGGDIHRIYFYLGTIGAPTPLTTSVQGYHKLGPSSYINNYTAYLQTVIAALCTIQKSVCEYCGRIGHKSYACTTCGTKLLPPILRINMNKFNAFHGEDSNEPPREWSIQPPSSLFKYRTSSTNTRPVVSAIMGRLNYHAVDNGDVKVHTSKF